MSDPASSDATEFARAVVSALIAAGVREVVIAPGSRNAPLSFAAYDAAEAGALRLHTRIDERSAGFLALGLTKAGSRAAVVCTSGTAAANLHPAVLEAAHAGVGLVVVTADRPASLRGTGANQTTDQVGIFGPAVPTVDLATGDVPLLGPSVTHWNVQFREPLTPSDRWVPTVESTPMSSGTVRSGDGSMIGHLTHGPRTVVVAGDDAGMRARQIAEAGGWPLLAEPSSGSRAGANAIRTYRLLLEGDLGAKIERVVVAGHPTLSRPVAQLLARAAVWELPARGIWPTRPFPVAGVLSDDVVVEGSGDPAWLEVWQATDRELGRRVDALLAEEGFTPHHVAAAVGNALGPG
ncbi:MAG TPA: thiamine pyrophosphate-binding protein, partial [Nocardioides sp.]|nr:thiamine pyrophosphate-binding protein [Nocardioides sp.]